MRLVKYYYTEQALPNACSVDNELKERWRYLLTISHSSKITSAGIPGLS